MGMLTNVISNFAVKTTWCQKLISWKHSFNRLNEEYEIAKKKKQALDNLFEKGRISQSTRDSFNNDLALAIVEIEKQQQDLLQKMQMKTGELEKQIQTLEMILANYEIQHVTGEIDENTYQLEINLLANGLTTAKHELENIIDATNHLCNPEVPVAAPEPIASPQIEVAPAKCMENVQVAVEIAPVEVAPAPIAPEPCVQASAPEPIATSEPAAVPVVEAPIVEPPTPVEAKVEAAPEPIAVQPAPVEVFEEKIVEQPAAGTVEIAQELPVEEPVAVPEEAVVEQTTLVAEAEKVEAAPEPIIEEANAVVEEAVVEPEIAEEAEVIQPEIVQADVPPIVEEIATANPFLEAPVAAQTEAAVETVPEVSAETLPQSTIPCAKELPTVIESASDSNQDK